MYWREKPVVGVEEAELPQFTIEGYETNERKIKLATGERKLILMIQKLKGYNNLFGHVTLYFKTSILFQELISDCHCHLNSNVTLDTSCSKHIFRQS